MVHTHNWALPLSLTHSTLSLNVAIRSQAFQRYTNMTMSRHPARSILMLVSSDPLSQIRLVMFLGDSLTRGFDPSNDTYPAWTLYMLLPNRYKAWGTAVINAAGSGMYD